jgi:hypothetical protein
VKLYQRNPSSFTPLLDGRYLLMGGGTMEETQRAIAQVSSPIRPTLFQSQSIAHHIIYITCFYTTLLEYYI